VAEVQKDVMVERENSIKLQQQKASLEKILNEAQLKLVDLETKGYSSASQDVKFLHKRIQEVSHQIHASTPVSRLTSHSLNPNLKTRKLSVVSLSAPFEMWIEL
jgi:hypothetical protein